MKRIALLLVWFAVVPPLRAGDEGEEARKTPTPTYENPILSLLLLPANLLIKMAALLAPSEPPRAQRDEDRAGQPAN